MGRKVGIFLVVLTLLLVMKLASAALFYYNPNATISGAWNRGTGTTHAEIIDAARQPTIPSTGSFVASRLGDGHTSEFRFPNITQTEMDNITLWVYTNTGNTVTYNFELRQGATVRCSNTVPANTPNSWRSCTWTNPSGDLSDLRIFLSTAEREVGGGPTNAVVYAAYLQVDTGPAPPVVTLNNPTNNSIQTSTPISFQFTAVDETFSTLSCNLYANFSGSFVSVATLGSVSNNTLSGFSQSPSDGVYLWNVMCNNTAKTAFSLSNRTVTVNAISPLVQNAALNESSIRQNRSVEFSANITDSFGISSALITLQYPNSTLQNLTLSNTGDIYSTTITNTLNPGTYTITLIWANDTLGQVGSTNPGLSFTVNAIPPTDFNLLSPINATETTNLTPMVSWEETTTPDFKNYTIQITKDSSFNTIEETYFRAQITNTSIQINALDQNSNYYFRVLAYDLFDNVKISNNTLVYITDNTSPSISLTNPTNNSFTTNSLTSFSFIPNDANTLDECILYTYSFESWAPVNSTSFPIKSSENTLSTTISEGINLWNVQCFDLANNSAFATNNRTVILDTTGPVITQISPINNSLINDTNIITFTAEAFDELSSVDSCSIYVNNTLEETITDITDNVSFEFEVFLINNVYEWFVECTDINGNSENSSSWILEVESLDNDPPVIALETPVNNFYSNSSTITFSYTPNDATGIEWCALYLNNSLAQNDSVVETFVSNNFTVFDLNETSYVWRVECLDNSSEFNLGVSNNRSFTVDLTNPVVTLNNPLNNSLFNITEITFTYTPQDNFLDYCELYTNESGWGVVQTNNSPSNNVENNITNIFSNGVFIWNVLCFDLSGRVGFDSNNRTITVDTTPPQFSDLSQTPESPVLFDQRLYFFNVTVTDNFDVDTVLFEHNFSGSFTNETITSASDIYSFNISNLNASSYSFRWFANDTASNSNNTNQFTYIVNKANSSINLYLNGSENNITINESQSVNISGNISSPSNGELNLYLNGELINQNFSSLENITSFSNPGSYNITLIYEESQNYLSSVITYFVNVQDITPPQVTLISPTNTSFVSSGNVVLQYQVNDSSEIDSCSLYINTILEDMDLNIEKLTTEAFIYEAEEGIYSWRVDCTDNASNTGSSETRTFEAVSTGAISLNVSSINNSYEIGEPINITINTSDIFLNPLVTELLTGLIDQNTSTAWWNASWSKRKNILLNETLGENQTNSLVQVNLTGLTFSNCQNDLRIINHNLVEGRETPFVQISSSGDWCLVNFYANLTANEVNNNDFYVYYDNPSAPSTSYEVVLQNTSSFFATESAADEGTPTNVANIIGFNDATFATLNQGGGGGTHSAHGRAFINSAMEGEITEVLARYRYQVPEVAGATLWELRYSVNGGTSYANAFSGTTAVTTTTTSSWTDITGVYPSLTWTNLNNTRLQARIAKTGGGSNTMYLFWVEMNITYNIPIKINQTTTSQEETLVLFNYSQTDITGSFVWSPVTNNLSPNNYTFFSLASKIGFDSEADFFNLELKPDITLPVVTLISPLNNSILNKELITLNYTVFDNNIDSCSLYLGEDSLILNQTQTVNNGLNFFEITPDYGEYIWNVLCNDTFSNEASGLNNLTFIVTVPNPNVSTSLTNNTFTLVWEAEPDATSYNIYIIENFSQGFFETPNVTGLTQTNYTISTEDANNYFYKITTVSDDKESVVGSFAGYYTFNLNEGFNMMSFPFLIGSYELKNSTNNGFTFNLDSDCLLSLWRYDSSGSSFEKTDWIGGEFVPASGSESFTSLEKTKGYFLETSTGCVLKIGGIVPTQNETIGLADTNNLVPWLSVNEKTLPSGFEPSIINTDPAFTVRFINKYNSNNIVGFDTTAFYFDGGEPWGWFPSSGSENFTSLKPGEGYYFNSIETATWIHDPLI
jgi:hypothetical protein